MKSNGRKESKVLPTVSILIVVMIIMGFVIFQFAAATPGKSDCQPDDWRCKEIVRLEETLAKNKLSNDMRKSLTAKLRALYYESTSQAEGIKRLTEMPTEAELARRQLRTPKVTKKPIERLTGIIERPAVALSHAFIINNAWQELVDGRYITVFAGALSEDPDQGILVVYDDSSDKYTIYASPSKDGSFRIVAAENFHLTLETTKKLDVYFDVLHPAFAYSLNRDGGATITPFLFPTVTLTPSPTLIPYPSP